MSYHFRSSDGHDGGSATDDRAAWTTETPGPAGGAPRPNQDPGVESIAARWQLAFSGFRPFAGSSARR